MIKPVENSEERPGYFIGDRWWLCYSKTESTDPTAPYRQYEFMSHDSGALGIPPIPDCAEEFSDNEEYLFATLMLLRAAPKMLTVLDWIARSFPELPHIECVRDVVKEAQWTQEEWFDKEYHG